MTLFLPQVTGKTASRKLLVKISRLESQSTIDTPENGGRQWDVSRRRQKQLAVCGV
jgi:hypothetical protein